ncbi:MAG: N(4)-(Beta-N-acetylglucosaminyl)-L-asparaginase [Phycisphaerae bacterium]|nr:N(4)-(Beta-N-acetylglucosaminyl)-L-asparaginase [Phycisphaerae bacterium]
MDQPASQEKTPQQPRKGPIAIASANGVEACKRAVERMRAGAPPVDAAVAGVNLVEDDPSDHSVGYGGIPNEDGVVELDASVMDGPSGKAGAVASIQRIKNPSSVALIVMRRTDHVLLVGDGARRFAVAHGFKEEDLLTDEARRIWLEWRESHSDKDDWLSPRDKADGTAARPRRGDDMTPRIHGTINLCALNEAGDLGGVTTTSGLAFKIPGRVGDSPIIGAGLYVDNAVGAAGSTGRGEANLQCCSSFLAVEFMRNGKSPEEACLDVLKRVADKCETRLRNERGEPNFGLTMYALSKDGRVGGASMHGKGKMAYHDGAQCRLAEIPGLFA